jgi:putative oxidoreductase
MAAVFLIGRFLLGGYLLYNGINHFLNVRMMSQFAAMKGVPAPEAAVMGAGVLLLVGGVSFLLGLYPKVGIAAMVLFFIGVTPMMHNFWAATTPQQQMGDMAHFMKNFGLMGATMMLAAIPEPWPYSVGVTRRIGIRS